MVAPDLPGRPTLDDIGEWSFPASDPPANWTWDVPVPRTPEPAAASAAGDRLLAHGEDPAVP